MNRIFILFIVSLLQLNLFASCERDESLESINTIKLKDGTQFRGEIINSTDTSIIVILEKGKRIEVKNSHLIIEEAASFIEGYAPVKIGGKWGYLNKKGALAILPRFDDAWNFSEGFAVVKIGAKYGCIDLDGNYVIEPQFHYMTRFSEGLSGVIKESHGYYIDRTGKIKFEADYDIIGIFKEGMASVSSREKWGFIDSTGNLSIALTYEEVRDFREGLAAVKCGEKWGFIDKKANKVVDIIFDFVSNYSEGLVAVKIDEKWGYKDMRGVWIIEPHYYLAGDFSSGVAFVTDTTLKGLNPSTYIDKNGKRLFHKKFAFGGPAVDEIASIGILTRVNKDNATLRFCYCNIINGNTITGLDFEDAGSFNDGMASVNIEGKWGFIDTSGKILVEPVFDKVENYSEGFAAVRTGDQWRFIDNKGKDIWNIKD